MQTLLRSMRQARTVRMNAADIEPVATSMVVVLTYWLSYEYVRDPRRALEPEAAQEAALGGARHVMQLLTPYLAEEHRMHLTELAGVYAEAAAH